LIEHWDGKGWSVDTTGPEVEGDSLAAVAAVSSNNGYAVGGGGGALVEHWNGSSWIAVFSPAFTGVGGLNAVSADSANDIWASEGETLLHFDGTNWCQVPTHTALSITAVQALSPTNVWAVGTAGVFFDHRTHRKAAIEHWDGSSWIASFSIARGTIGADGIIRAQRINRTDDRAAFSRTNCVPTLRERRRIAD
jgi:hypothetical protein